MEEITMDSTPVVTNDTEGVPFQTPPSAETLARPERKTYDKAKAQLTEQLAKLTPDKVSQYEGKAADDATERTLIDEAQKALEAGNTEKATTLLKAYRQEKSHFKALAEKELNATRENQPRPKVAEATGEAADETTMEVKVEQLQASTQEQEALEKTLLDLQGEIKALEEALIESGFDASTLPDLSKLSTQNQQKLFLETQKTLGRTNLAIKKTHEFGLLPAPTSETPNAPIETTPQTSETERIRKLVDEEVARILNERQQEKPLTSKEKVIDLVKQGGGYALMLLMLMQIFMAEMEK